MNFSFGIVTDGSSEAENRLDQMINSIQNQNIPSFEIIIVGNCRHRDGVKTIAFDENIKPKWITRKKNLITDNAVSKNIVYMHDYITLDLNWYTAWKSFAFDVGTNPIYTLEGRRFRDWTLCPETPQSHDPILEATKARVGSTWYDNLLPYSETSLSRFMYISGSYWVAKKRVMQEFPLNEDLVWGQGEDLDWSLRVRKKYAFSLNRECSVKILKPSKEIVFVDARPEVLQALKEASNA